jgi:uncharacterized protein (TIGR00266 family)
MMEYRIIGSTMPLVEITMDKGETIKSQAGAMKWMTSDVLMETGISGGVVGALKRKIVGEGIFFNYFTGKTNGTTVAFGHTYPGMIIPLSVSNKTYICQQRAFLCAEESVRLDIALHKKLRVGFFGGEGFIMQKLSGKGLAFIEIDGECVEIDLGRGDSIKVETGAVGAIEDTVSMNIELVKGLGNIFFGGEGLFLTTLTGPGRVWLQTMPIQNMARELSRYMVRPQRKK